MQTTVLLVGTAQPSAHAVARSLSRGGYRVVGTRETARLAGRTRYCERTHILPPAERLEEFVAAVAAVSAAERVDVVIPLADETLGALLRRRPPDAKWVLAGPPPETFAALSDKSNLARIVRSVGLAAPAEIESGPGRPLEEIPPLPAYVKIVSGITDGVAAGRPIRVSTEAECRDAVARIVGGGRTVVVQEEVAGERWRFHYARSGDVVHHVAARTVADHPPRVGQSTVSLFGPTPPEVAAAGSALLRAAGCEGVGSIQMIVRDGVVYPHDVNLRIPASVAGTIAAGLDLPRYGVEIALGRPVAPPSHAASRLRFVQLHGELAAFRQALGGDKFDRSAATIATEIAFDILLPGRVAEPFDIRDPLPTLAAIAGARTRGGTA